MGKTEWTRIEKHLYKYQHQDAHGQWSTKYYAIFNDWKGIPRRFPLSEKLESARNKLGEYRRKNDAEFDFDAEKRQREEEAKQKEEAERKGLTLGEWAQTYFDMHAPTLDKRIRTIERGQEHWTKLEPHFGSMALCDIKLTEIASYRLKREREVSFVTANRELSFVRYLLHRALEDGKLDAAPRIRLRNEQSTVRTRTLCTEEYIAIISHMRRKQQRYYIGLYETSMRLREPLRLTWEKIDLKTGLIRFKADDVKEKWPRRTPITWEFRQVLEELRREQTKIAGIPKLDDLVFKHKNGEPMKDVREAWIRAVAAAIEKKELPDDDVRPHDLRRTAITNWTALGIPRDIVMACSGHKPNGVHDGYVNFSDQQLVDAFREHGLMLPPSQRKKHAASAKAV